jgi:hypothetical protein
MLDVFPYFAQNETSAFNARFTIPICYVPIYWCSMFGCPPEADFRTINQNKQQQQATTTTSKGGAFADLAAGRRRASAWHTRYVISCSNLFVLGGRGGPRPPARLVRLEDFAVPYPHVPQRWSQEILSSLELTWWWEFPSTTYIMQTYVSIVRLYMWCRAYIWYILPLATCMRKQNELSQTATYRRSISSSTWFTRQACNSVQMSC